jgi:hypothetical protein
MPTRAERFAGLVRLRLDFRAPPASPAMLIALAPVEVLAMDWPDELAGILVLRPSDPAPSATIGLNRRHSAGRRHFTFWHEVGHYVLHRRAALHGPLACLHAKDEAAYPSMEREADLFAAAVLMPEDWVRRAYAEGASPERLARQFAVTRLAMTRRLAELGLQ